MFEIQEVSGWRNGEQQDKDMTKLLSQHWKACWKAAGYDTTTARQDDDDDEQWEQMLQSFGQQNQANGLQPRTFVARRSQDPASTTAKTTTPTVIGSIQCQIWAGPLPWVVQPHVFRLGTVWGLHMNEDLDSAMSRSVRRQLLQVALNHLQSVQCSKVVTLALTKEDRDNLVDAMVGFQSANMLTLDLNEMKRTIETAEAYNCGPADASTDEGVVVQNWKRMWNDVGIPREALIPNMKDVTLSFLQQARERLHYQTFVARATDGNIVGSISCQIWEGPIPTAALVSKDKFQLGTIWAVYVDPAHRRRGVATELMQLALRHLKNAGCDRAILIAASEGGKCVYERLGFQPNNALVCDLAPASSDNEKIKTTENKVDEEKKQEEWGPMVSESMKSDLRQALKGLVDEKELSPSQFNALASATSRQIFAVYSDRPRVDDIAVAVANVQREHGIYVDDNWFTQNLQKFGRGFDMTKLKEDPSVLASKFDRLSSRYDHWTVGNKSKIESFIVRSARNNGKVLNDGSARVLDVACGIGLQGQVLRMLGFGGSIIGTDISKGMVHRVMERGCYDHAYVANANESLAPHDGELRDSLFDIAICTGAMELLDHEKALKDIALMTKPQGEIWVSFQQETTENPTEHQNVRGISEETALHLLRDAGFANVVSVYGVVDAFHTPSPKQDGSLLAVPYLFIVAKKAEN